jgi:isochorismate synthase
MKDFFTKITTQYANKLPFVAYKKPKETSLNMMFQTDASLNYTKDYSERGFVFAPFDHLENTVLIPSDHSLTCVYKQEEDTIVNNNVELNLSAKEQHIDLVTRGVFAIQNTNLKKIVLSRVEQVVTETSCPLTLFKRALAQYEDAFIYLWYHPKVGCWIGATPEVLLKIRNNQFKTMALAGTQLFSDALVWDEKEKEEQQIVTDYIVENLNKKNIKHHLGEVHTVKAGHLAHIRTDITGSLGEHNLQNLISVLHPTPAVCGLPKHASKTFILHNESYKRTFYTGFLGELNKESQRKNNRRNTENNAYRITTKSSDLYVNLRCMELKNNAIYIYVGGGITASSNPENEFFETCNKTKTMKKLIIS